MRTLTVATALAFFLTACSDDPSTMCPVATDPKVHYVADSDRDPTVCQTIRFVCAEGATPFSNECGCGCLLP